MSAENAPERITRWECPEHGADSGPGKRCGQMARPYVLCHREKVEVEYVRADLADASDDDERREMLSRIGREVRYRDALHEIRAEVERLRGLITTSGREVATRKVLATIDGALDIGGEFCGLPEPGGDQ